jgi:perosamine synthetase
MSQLAIFGGPRAVDRSFGPYPSMGKREAAAVARVMESGTLSAFYGSWSDEFFGGPQVRAFERAWGDRFGSKHVVSVNSATSALIAAMGAVGVTPGSEVIVPPLTMSATAVAPLFYGGIPVFVDLEPDTFSLDIEGVKKAITPKTKAIIAVNLFGHPAHLEELRAIADAHHIALVEDNAQSILMKEHGRFAGTVGHIGVFSLNYHKHIHAGEGGMCATDDDALARKMQMIRNHAENIVEPTGMEDPTNMVGFNFRLTELAAAIGIEQLASVEEHVGRRVRIGERLTEAAQGLEGLTPPSVRAGCTHAYYIWALRVDAKKLGVSRDVFAKALEAEGFPNATGYVRPLYHLPLFQKRVAFGGYPFNLTERTYLKGMCPVAERLHFEEIVNYEPCASDVDDEGALLLGSAIRKVHRHRDELAARQNEVPAS